MISDSSCLKCFVSCCVAQMLNVWYICLYIYSLNYPNVGKYTTHSVSWLSTKTLLVTTGHPVIPPCWLFKMQNNASAPWIDWSPIGMLRFTCSHRSLKVYSNRSSQFKADARIQFAFLKIPGCLTVVWRVSSTHISFVGVFVPLNPYWGPKLGEISLSVPF